MVCDVVSFDSNQADRTLIDRIVVRFGVWTATQGVALTPDDILSLRMDLTAAHSNGNPLRLTDLLNAPEFDFLHDVTGIMRYLDRGTGRLQNHFSPRFSRRAEVA